MPEHESFPYRIIVRPILLRQPRIHHSNERRSLLVCIREGSSAKQWNAERADETGDSHCDNQDVENSPAVGSAMPSTVMSVRPWLSVSGIMCPDRSAFDAW